MRANILATELAVGIEDGCLVIVTEMTGMPVGRLTREQSVEIAKAILEHTSDSSAGSQK